MIRDSAVIIGGTSYIANLVLPYLNLDVKTTYFISRNSASEIYPKISGLNKVVRISKYDENRMEHVILETNLNQNSSVLMINFAGTLGNLNEGGINNINEFYETFHSNLDPFLNSVNIFSQAGPNSLYITFSGAGVGGDSLDDSSLGYLCAKTSMAILVETLQEKFKSQDKHVCSIAPGPFPSQMQKSLLDTRLIHKINPLRIKAAEMVVANGGSTKKLISVLNLVIAKPENFGGRIISANFDDFESIEMNDRFGKLRRALG